jgi:hypothetical protein
MANYQAISIERHSNRCWQRYSSYAFAAADAVVHLAVTELPRAAMSLPIAFIEQGGSFIPVAVLGLHPGKNLFVMPDGRWVGGYIPDAFRAYPFRMAKMEDGKEVLCIDEDSGLVTDGHAGERFFTEDGQPTQAVLEVLNFRNQIEQNRLATAVACAVLQKHNLFCAWPITLKTASGEQQVTGLFQIDEAALNTLTGEALLEVRQGGALLLAYCQLLSMQHLSLLGQLVEAHAKAAAQAQAAQHIVQGGEIDLEFMNKAGTISFGGMG